MNETIIITNDLSQAPLDLVHQEPEATAVTHTLAPSSHPATAATLRTRARRESRPYPSTKRTPRNPRTPVSAASIEKTDPCRRSRTLSPSHKFSTTNPEPTTDLPRKKKSTKLRSRLKNTLAIFRKKSSWLVSCPREPLENYDVSKNTVGESTNSTKTST